MPFTRILLATIVVFLTVPSFAGQGYLRMVCFGLDTRGDMESRNNFAAVIQQTDNSVASPGAFIVGHEDYDPKAIIASINVGDVMFAAKVFFDAADVDQSLPAADYAEALLKLNPSEYKKDLFGEKLADNFYVIDDSGDFSINSYWHKGKVPGVNDKYTHIGKNPGVMDLECMKPFIVDSPSIEPAAETDETTTAMKK